MRAVVFSGTTEGRIFSRQLAQLGADVLVSVATPLGSEEQGSFAGIMVHCGRLTPDEMAALVQGADLCVDATHPYAVDATRNIRTACRTAGVEYHRLLRAPSALPAGSMVLQSAAHVADLLAQTQGNVLLATGAKELPAFAQLAPERLYPRVLPTLDGIAACEAAHIPQEYPCFTGAVLLRAEPGPAGAVLHSLSRDQGRRGRRWLCRESAGCRRHRRPAHRDPPPGRDR